MAEGDTRRIFERLDQMAQEITRLVVLGEAKNRQCDQQEKTIADHEERITNLECQIIKIRLAATIRVQPLQASTGRGKQI